MAQFELRVVLKVFVFFFFFDFFFFFFFFCGSLKDDIFIHRLKNQVYVTQDDSGSPSHSVSRKQRSDSAARRSQVRKLYISEDLLAPVPRR